MFKRRSASAAAWATAFVCGLPGPAASAADLHVPAAYLTIQAAIDAAAPGDTVIVADGTYTGTGNRDMDFGGKAITVRSANGAAACFIDVQGSQTEPHRAFHFQSGEKADSVLEGFTIQNGFMNRGGAILCENKSSPQIRGCVFRQNTAWPVADSDGGGAIYCINSDLDIAECEFVQNHTEVTLDITGGGAMRVVASGGTLADCVFSNNTVVGPGSLLGFGGAISLGGTVVSTVSPTITNCTFVENAATRQGGAVSSRRNDGEPLLVNCVFLGNQQTYPPSGFGAGFAAVGLPGLAGRSTLINCSFSENTAATNGGGVGIVETGATVTGCTFRDNVATDGRGAGAFIARNADATLANCVFLNNAAPSSIYPGGALAVFEQNPIANVVNCTVAGNTAAAGGGGIAALNGTTNVRNSILYGNGPDEILDLATLTASYSNVKGGWFGTGNIDENPSFVDVAAGNLRLAPGSPCIDAGANALVPAGLMADFDGNARFRDDLGTANTGAGGPPAPGAEIVDMGAYELQLTTGCPGDLNGDKKVDQSDLGTLLACYGVAACGDLDLDGDTDQADLGILLANYGVICP